MAHQHERACQDGAEPDAVADELRHTISSADERIARQEKRVARLSVQFGLAELREEAKIRLADMKATRDLLVAQLRANDGGGGEKSPALLPDPDLRLKYTACAVDPPPSAKRSPVLSAISRPRSLSIPNC